MMELKKDKVVSKKIHETDNHNILKYWGDYSTSDYFGKKDLLKQLPFFQALNRLLDPVQMREEKYRDAVNHIVISTFQSYIDDIFKLVGELKSPNETRRCR